MPRIMDTSRSSFPLLKLPPELIMIVFEFYFCEYYYGGFGVDGGFYAPRKVAEGWPPPIKGLWTSKYRRDLDKSYNKTYKFPPRAHRTALLTTSREISNKARDVLLHRTQVEAMFRYASDDGALVECNYPLVEPPPYQVELSWIRHFIIRIYEYRAVRQSTLSFSWLAILGKNTSLMSIEVWFNFIERTGSALISPDEVEGMMTFFANLECPIEITFRDVHRAAMQDYMNEIDEYDDDEDEDDEDEDDEDDEDEDEDGDSEGDEEADDGEGRAEGDESESMNKDTLRSEYMLDFVENFRGMPTTSEGDTRVPLTFS